MGLGDALVVDVVEVVLDEDDVDEMVLDTADDVLIVELVEEMVLAMDDEAGDGVYLYTLNAQLPPQIRLLFPAQVEVHPLDDVPPFVRVLPQ